MKTTKNLILSLMMVVLCLCFASTTVFAATMTCDEAEEILNRDNGQSSTYWLCYNDPVVVGGRESVACRTAMAKHQEAEAKKKACDAPAVCPYTSPFNFNTLGNAYKVDNSPYQVWIKTLKSNGDYVFCIEPETAFVSCSDYHAGGNIPEWARIEVSMVVNAFKQSPTTDHYIAAQMHIWEVMGSYRTVNGLDKWAYGFGDLQNLMSYGDSHEYYSVSLAEDMYYLDLGESVNNNDNNAQMHNDYFHVAASAGAAATKDGNKVVASMTEIYPLEKNINVNSTKETETSGGDIHGGTVYASSSIRSQTMFSFNGSINTIKYKHFSGDSFKIKTNTGDLKVHKVDEWGDPVDEGTTFRIWYAVEDPEGTAKDADGKTYSKYKEFATEADWKNGKVQSTFTIDENGTFEVKGTMASGGTFSDGTPVGTYIVQEVFTTNPYELNGKEYVVKIKENAQTELTVTNDKRIVSLQLTKKDSEEGLLLNNAVFAIYDISGIKGLSLDTNEGANPVLNNYFVKVGKSVDLNELFASDGFVSTLASREYALLNSHCNTVSLEGSVLTANQNDIVYLSVSDGSSSKTMTVYVVSDDDVLDTEDSFVISGVGVYSAKTGHNYVQIVDQIEHSLPVAGFEMTLYDEEELLTPVVTVTTDLFGMVDLSELTLENKKEAGNYYFKDYDGTVKSVDSTLIGAEDADKKGTLTVENLKHSRFYLVCEAATPENYDIEAGSNPCFYLDTSDYSEEQNSSSDVRYNTKGRGNLEINKVNEWFEPAGEGIKFKIYHAKLEDNGLSYEENYKNIVLDEDGHLLKGDLVISPEGTDVFEVDEDGKIKLTDYLYYGYYVIEEVETTNPYMLNTEQYDVFVGHGKTNEVQIVNENRVVSFKVNKVDSEEPGVVSDETLTLNDARFTIYDASKLKGKAIDLANGRYTEESVYFLKKNSSVDLNLLFDLKDAEYRLLTEHCATVKLEGTVLHAYKNDIVCVEIETENNIWTEKIYIVNEDNSLSSESAGALEVVPVFSGLTGHNYIQIVDEDFHFYPVSNHEVIFYDDEALTLEVFRSTTDEFGMVDLTLLEVEDKKESGSYYYEDYDGTVESIDAALVGKLNKEEGSKGVLTADNLKHSRTYLVCEESTPDNYDIAAGTNPCFFLDTKEYEDEVRLKETTIFNTKGRGNLEFSKLNEWYESAGKDVQFKLYRALLQDTGLSYEENYMNLVLDEAGNPIKGEQILTPEGLEYFNTDENGEINLLDYLEYGYYILEEVDATNPYVLNPELILLKIEHAATTESAFVNANRSVAFEIYKVDAEENYRKINGAEYTIYDISETLDTDKNPTDLGVLGDLTVDAPEKDEVDPMMQVGGDYTVDALRFVKLGTTLDLYDYIVASTEYESYIDHRPIKFRLSHDTSGSVDVYGMYTASKTGMLKVDVLGGAYTLYGTAGPKLVREGDAFDPYANLYFFEDEELSVPVQIETIEYTGDFDTSVLGEYTLHYTMVSKDHVKYEFDRVIEVIKEDRHICRLDPNTGEYYYLDTKELCDEIDLGMMVEYESSEMVPLILTDKPVEDNWNDTFVTSVTFYIVSNNDLIDATPGAFELNGLGVFRGQTGHSYIQLIDKTNHDLPLAHEKLTVYYDSAMKYPYKEFISDEFGMIDLNDESVEPLADYPMAKQDEETQVWYVEKAVKTTSYTCVDGYSLSEEKKCVKESDDTVVVEPKIEESWNVEKEELTDFDPMLDAAFLIKHDVTEVYYSDGDSAVAKSATVEQEAGTLSVPHLKHSRTYLICESQLPVGYDYVDGNNPCFVLDTSEYPEGVEHTSVINENIIRRIDVAVYKTNSSGNKKLDGAVFDVYETFEEGKDMNIIDGSIAQFNLKETDKGTKFYTDELGKETNEEGLCIYDEEADDPSLKDVKLVGVDDAGNETDKDSPVGACYRVYEPETIERKHLGRYVSGGIYQYFEAMQSVTDKENGTVISALLPLSKVQVEIATDKDMKNIVKTVTTNAKGEIEVLGLGDGVYYTRIVRPLKETFVAQTTDPETGVITIHVPSEDDYVPYDNLDSVYSSVPRHQVKTGMIRLDDIKYGHSLLFVEVKAPSGYLIKDKETVIVPKTEYGIHLMYNTIKNDEIPITNTGVAE